MAKSISKKSEYVEDIQDDIEKNAEEPAGSPLGRIAFAQNRRGLPNEENTDEEQDIFDGLKSHIRNNDPFSTDTAQKIKKLMSKHLYTGMFKEPESSPVYRGMAVSPEWLAKAFKIKAYDKATSLRSNLAKGGSIEKNFTFTPITGAGSSAWSTDLRTAKKFANDGPQEVPIILYAYVEDNKNKFLDLKANKNNGIYSLGPMQGFEKEKENIGLGKIKVFKVEWLKHSAW